MKLLLGLLLFSPFVKCLGTEVEVSGVQEMVGLAMSVVSAGTSNRDALIMQFANIVGKLRRQGPTNATAQFITSLTNTIETSLKPQLLESFASLQAQVNMTYTKGYAACDSQLQNDTGLNGPLMQAIQEFISWPFPFQRCKANESQLQAAYNASVALNSSLAANQASACSNFTRIDQLPTISCGANANENTTAMALRMMNLFTEQQNLWLSAQQACIQATANSVVQNSSTADAFNAWKQSQSTCGRIQDTMDATSCSVFTTSQTICNSYQGCYNRFTTAFQSFIPAWQTSQQELAVQWGIFLQMQCLMGTLTMSNTSINSQVLANCTNSSMWTAIANRSVQLYYPPAQKTRPCALAVGFSGTADYVRDQYSILPSNAQAKNCVSSCCATSTTTTTTVLATAPWGSALVTSSDQQLLFRLGLSSQSPWTLCFRRSRDGASWSTFHSLCDGKGPSITVMTLSNGLKTGGYRPVSWDLRGVWDTSTGAWLFSINGGQASKYTVSRPEHSSWSGSGYGPWFGNVDLGIVSTLSSVQCTPTGNYQLSGSGPSNPCGSQGIFSIIDLEVFVNYPTLSR